MECLFELQTDGNVKMTCSSSTCIFNPYGKEARVISEQLEGLCVELIQHCIRPALIDTTNLRSYVSQLTDEVAMDLWMVNRR